MAWVNERLNGHFLPVPKILGRIFWILCDGPNQIDKYFGCVLLIMSSILLTETARTIRGRIEFSDAIIPVAVFNAFGVHEYLRYYLSDWIFLFFFLSSYLIWFCSQEKCRLRSAIFAAVAIILLPIQGGMGLAISPLFLACIGVKILSLQTHGNRTSTNTRLILISALLLSTSITLWNGIQSISSETKAVVESRDDSLTSKGIASIKAASTSLGYVGARAWPISGILVVAFSLAAFTFCVTQFKAKKWRSQKICIALCAIGTWLVPIAIGLSRGESHAFANRFWMPTSLILICGYLAFCGRRYQLATRVVRYSLFFITTFFGAFHLSLGLEMSKRHRTETEKVLQDIENHLPIKAIAARNVDYWCYSEESFESGIRDLRDLGVEPFKAISADPSLIELDIPIAESSKGIFEASQTSSSGLSEIKNARAIQIYFTVKTKLRDNNNFITLLASEPKTLSRIDPFKIAIPSTGPNKRRRTIWLDGETVYLPILVSADPALINIEKITALIEN